MPDSNTVSPIVPGSLNVLMVAPTSFFNDYGGHIRILEETLALQRLGHKITIVTYAKGGDVPGLDIRRTATLPWHPDYEVGSSRHKLAFDLYLEFKTLQIGLRDKPDVVHGHMHEGALIGATLARLLRVPLVFDFQGSLSGEMVDHGFLNPCGRTFSVVRRFEKGICNLADATLTSSLQAQKLLIEQFGVKPETIHPLPDCVDDNRFDPNCYNVEQKADLKRKLGVPTDRLVVAYLGLLAGYQGTSHLIEAAVQLKQEGLQIHFLVMGYPRVNYYRQLALQAGVSDMMTFTGKVSYEKAPLYLSLGDLAVTTKISTTEGSGKVLNYMAMALPVVAYDTPVHREYLGDLGVYSPAGDIDSLAAAIGSLADDKGRRHDLGQKLRQRASETYSWRQAGEQINELYNSLTRR